MEVDISNENGLHKGPIHKQVTFNETPEVAELNIDFRPQSDGGADGLVTPLTNGSSLPGKKIVEKEKDRHSRTGRRGLPKKGGAGGKGTWGKLTEVYSEEQVRDNKDPNYGSDEEDYIISPSSPQMSPEEFQKEAEVIFREYFDHGDTAEVKSSLTELNIRNIKSEIVRVLIILAMEARAPHRELASVLLSDLACDHVINTRDISLGFNAVFQQLEELSLDTPDAAEILGNFIARCVADDCLPPCFVNNHINVTDLLAQSALKRASLFLNMKHGLARLDSIWGVGGGQRPVVFLVKQIVLLLKEYLSSGDRNEAVRCLSELEVPHFHHELVYQAVVLALEDGSEQCIKLITDLLQHMAQIAVLMQDQIERGFVRVYGAITDIVLDAPHAYTTLSKIVEGCLAAALLSRRLALQLPQRGRKRFVSEGDGGAIKNPEA